MLHETLERYLSMSGPSVESTCPYASGGRKIVEPAGGVVKTGLENRFSAQKRGCV